MEFWLSERVSWFLDHETCSTFKGPRKPSKLDCLTRTWNEVAPEAWRLLLISTFWEVPTYFYIYILLLLFQLLLWNKFTSQENMFKVWSQAGFERKVWCFSASVGTGYNQEFKGGPDITDSFFFFFSKARSMECLINWYKKIWLFSGVKIISKMGLQYRSPSKSPSCSVHTSDGNKIHKHVN